MTKKTRKIGMALGLALSLALVPAAPAFAEDGGFADVAKDAWYAEEVAWAVENNITDGVGDNRFDPTGEVSRAQVATFLWRMAGEPEPTATETFSDVEAGSWYEPAVRWAVENGITKGTGDNRFSPFVTCDRAMCLTLLYRLEGSPLDEIAAAAPVEIGEDSSTEEWGAYFVQQMIQGIRDSGALLDVEDGAYYELPVFWGLLNGIITEDNADITDEGARLRPADPCVRAEMVSFLYQTRQMEDAANAPSLEEYGPVTVSVPKEYYDLVYRISHAIGDDEDGILVTYSERASRDAAEAMGQDPDETGAGELFSIGRVSEEEAEKLRSEDLGFAEVFAKDGNGKYYVYYHPTDVRFVRETPEQMQADQEQWTALNEWAWNHVRDDILQNSEGLTAVE